MELKMKIKHLHSWDVSPKEAAKIQRNLACKVSLNWKNFIKLRRKIMLHAFVEL